MTIRIRSGKRHLVSALMLLAIWSGSANSQPGTISTLAGNGDGGDGGNATDAQLFRPERVAVDSDGNIFISDTRDQRIRIVTPGDGLIGTVAGTGNIGFSGDGGPGNNADIATNIDVAMDSNGNLYFADAGNNRIRRVDFETGFISAVAGTGNDGFSGDGGPATLAELNSPHGVALDSAGNIFIADTNNQRIRRIDSGTGFISTIAGTGVAGFSGDFGPATAAPDFVYPLRGCPESIQSSNQYSLRSAPSHPCNAQCFQRAGPGSSAIGGRYPFRWSVRGDMGWH